MRHMDVPMPLYRPNEAGLPGNTDAQRGGYLAALPSDSLVSAFGSFAAQTGGAADVTKQKESLFRKKFLAKEWLLCR